MNRAPSPLFEATAALAHPVVPADLMALAMHADGMLELQRVIHAIYARGVTDGAGLALNACAIATKEATRLESPR